MISKIIRNFHIRYSVSMMSNPKKQKYVIYTYSGYRFKKEKEKGKKLSVNDVIGNHQRLIKKIYDIIDIIAIIANTILIIIIGA